MEPNEDSIKLLETRMRKQMNNSPDKNIKMENIQYLVASAVMQQEARQDLQQEAQQDLQQESRQDLQQTGFEDEDAEITENHDMATKLVESDEYEKLLANIEYIERAGRIPEVNPLKISETKEVQHARAVSGYRRVRQVLETGEAFETKRVFPFDVKG